MHTIKTVKYSLSLAVTLLMSSTAFAEPMQHDHTMMQASVPTHVHQQHTDMQPSPLVPTERIKEINHKHEHGGQIYTLLELDQRGKPRDMVRAHFSQTMN